MSQADSADMSKVQERIATLKEQINRHNYSYYLLDAPAVPDAGYDRLLWELSKQETSFPQFISSDSPTQRVGAKPTSSFN